MRRGGTSHKSEVRLAGHLALAPRWREESPVLYTRFACLSVCDGSWVHLAALPSPSEEKRGGFWLAFMQVPSGFRAAMPSTGIATLPGLFQAPVRGLPSWPTAGVCGRAQSKTLVLQSSTDPMALAIISALAQITMETQSGPQHYFYHTIHIVYQRNEELYAEGSRQDAEGSRQA